MIENVPDHRGPFHHSVCREPLIPLHCFQYPSGVRNVKLLCDDLALVQTLRSQTIFSFFSFFADFFQRLAICSTIQQNYFYIMRGLHRPLIEGYIQCTFGMWIPLVCTPQMVISPRNPNPVIAVFRVARSSPPASPTLYSDCN